MEELVVCSAQVSDGYSIVTPLGSMPASYEDTMLILGSKVKLNFEEACFNLLKEEIKKQGIVSILDEAPTLFFINY